MYRFIFADTETTGVSTSDKVCELAWREVDKDFNVVREDYSLINPGKPIHYAASAVNGITDDMVRDAPSLEDYMVSLGNPLMGEDVVLICHNAPFDYRYLKPYMSPEAQTICTLRCARMLYPDAANHKQATLAAMLGVYVDRSKAHAADGDLDVLMTVTRVMCAEHNLTLPDLLQVQARKRQIALMPFGKHKGTKLTELPRNYVSWLLKEANLDEDLRASLEAI